MCCYWEMFILATEFILVMEKEILEISGISLYTV